MKESKNSRELRVAVIGGGMSGILCAIKLQEIGVTDFCIYEKAESLGGTWRDNTYPGLACDVPSHLYSYSFEPNSQWTRKFSPGREIRDYEDKNLFRQNPSVMENMHSSMSKSFSESFSNAVVGANPEQLKLIQTTCEENLNKNVKNLELKERLTPDYQAACKRLVMSDDFYDAIQKTNANLITDPIEKIQSDGILTRDGTLHQLDIVVLATGFNAHQFMRPMNVSGKNEYTLDEHWQDTTSAYRSVSIPGFPNFFTLIGPNSPVGNFSLIEVAEIQLKYILQLIELIRKADYSEIAAKKSVTDRFNKDLTEAMKGTVWVSGCRSWYLDKHGNPATWPWTFDRFFEDMKKPDLEDFDLVAN